MNTVLTIAGTDPTGGAGLHADLKTFCAHGVYGMGVVTAVVAQNTRGVIGYTPVARELLRQQLDAVFSDIFPDAVKIGMLPDIAAINTVADALETWDAKRIILDPVMVSTSEHRLQNTDAATIMAKRLFHLCELITPNLAEAEQLCGFPITDRNSMEKAAQAIHRRYEVAVLVTGGHLDTTCDDLFFDGKTIIWIQGKKVETNNTHGTGCTLAAAIASNRAQGRALHESVRDAKDYIYRALLRGLDIGTGNGPLDHGASGSNGK